jgi:hypothetical protein
LRMCMILSLSIGEAPYGVTLIWKPMLRVVGS